MPCITKVDKRTLERITEAVDWLSYPVHISVDKGGEIHIALSVRMGDSAHYSRAEDPDPVAKFIDILVPDCAKFLSITFKEPNAIDKITVEDRDDCLVIHNTRGAPSLDICTLMEVLEVDKITASRTLRRIDRKRVEQICLTRPRKEWMLSQNRA